LVGGERGNGAAVLIWSADSGARVATIVGHQGTVTHARLSPLGDLLVVVSEEKELSSSSSSAQGAAAPGGPAVAASVSASVRSNVSVWRISDAQLVWSHTGEQVQCMDWSADNTYFALGGSRFLRLCYVRPGAAGGIGTPASAAAPPVTSSTSLNADPAYTRPLLEVAVRDAKLVKNADADFVALACGQGQLSNVVFGLSRHGQGVVCVFKDKSLSASTAVVAAPASGSGAPGAAGAAATGGVRWEIEKWMDVRMKNAAALSVVEDLLAVGGGEGKLRLFVASSLKHVDTLPKPAPLPGSSSKEPPTVLLARLCPGIGGAAPQKLVAVYSDRVLSVWNIARKPWTVFASIRSHAGPVWDLAVLSTPSLAKKKGSGGGSSRPSFDDDDYDSDAEAEAERAEEARAASRLPEGCFASCSGDGTLRVWGPPRKAGAGSIVGGAASGSSAGQAQVNLGDIDCLKTMYVAPVLQGPLDERREQSANTGGIRCLRFIPPVPGAAPPPAPITGKVGEIVGDQSSNSSSLLSHYPDGLLASGDRGGFVRLHSLSSLNLSDAAVAEKDKDKPIAPLACMEIHENEVRSLDFALASGSLSNTSSSNNHSNAPSSVANLPLLISSGRDTTVHVHNIFHPTSPATFTPDVVHQGPVTAVRAVTLPPLLQQPGASSSSNSSDVAQGRERMLLLSGGLDRQLVLQSLCADPAPASSSAPVGPPSSSVDLCALREASLLFEKGQVQDLVVHPTRQFAAVLLNNVNKKAEQAALNVAASNAAAGAGAGSNKLGARAVNFTVQMIDLSSLTRSRSYVITSLGGGDPLRLALDPSGTLLAVTCSDKSVLLLDWYTGAVLGSFFGHASPPTSVAFTADCRALVTGGRDGTIMLWQLDKEYANAMTKRRKELDSIAAAKPVSAASGATAAKKDTAAGGAPGHKSTKSTAQSLLGDDTDEEEEDEAAEEAKSPGAAAASSSSSPGAASPSSTPVPSSLPPLANGGSSPKAASTAASAGAGSVTSAAATAAAGAPSGAAAASYKPRALPSWARSTVVSPEAPAGAGSVAALAEAAENLPVGGMGIGLGPGGVEQQQQQQQQQQHPGAPKGKWAARVEVGPDGAPLVPALAAGGKVYGDLGTLGPGTLLLDEFIDEDLGLPAAGGGSASARARGHKEPGGADDDDIDIDDEEIDSEDGSGASIFGAGSSGEPGAGGAGGISGGGDGGGGGARALGSSLTAKHFARLRDEGKLPSGSFGVAGSSAHPSFARSSPIAGGLRAREAQTSAETALVRQHLKELGVLDAQGQPLPSPSPSPPAAPQSSPKPSYPEAAASADQPASASSILPAVHGAAAAPAGSLQSSSEFVAAPGVGVGTNNSEPSTPAASLPFSNSFEPALLPPLPTSPDPAVSGIISPPRAAESASPVKLPAVVAVPGGAAASGAGGSGSSASSLGSPLQPGGVASPSRSGSASGSSASVSASTSVHASLAALPAQVAQFQSSLQQMLEGFGAVRAVLDSSANASTRSVRASSVRPTLPAASIRPVSVSLSFAHPLALGDAVDVGASSSAATLPFVSPAALDPARLVDFDTVQAVYEAQLDTMAALLAQARPHAFQPPLPSVTASQQASQPPLSSPSAAPASSPLDPLAQSAAVSAQLAEMRAMLSRIEAHTLSTTQQLSLGLTLSGPTGPGAAAAVPPKSFSRSPDP
jgi:WD40 repeat protein